jgi:guanine deaminase
VFLGSGLMDYRAARDAGARLALGSDVAGGPDLFMPRVARGMIEVGKIMDMQSPAPSAPITATEAFWQMTLGNAEAMAMEQDIGSLDVGKHADLLVVSPPMDLRDAPPPLQVARLLYGLRPDDVRHVIVKGRLVHSVSG